MTPLPPHARALFALLQGEAVSSLDDPAWRELLRFADRTQSTLFLRTVQGLPEWFPREIEARFARNAARRVRLLDEYAQVAHALGQSGIPFVLLKSFTHEVGFGIVGAERVQYDIDLLCAPAEAGSAEAALREVGYAPQGTSELSDLHGRPLLRPSAWSWREDYYDPEMPIPVEVHSRLWSSSSERIPVPGIEKFWDRRIAMEAQGMKLPALAEADRAAFAALHALRHILHNNLRLSHVIELARLLDARATDAAFWETWRQTHDESPRRLQTVAFRFAREWFRCPWPSALEEQWTMLPRAVHSWFERFAFSPVANLIRPNKDVVWLHSALVERRMDRMAVLWQRLAPLKLPDPVEAGGASYPGHFGRRLRYHAAALAPALWSGFRWRRAAASNASQTSDWNRPSV